MCRQSQYYFEQTFCPAAPTPPHPSLLARFQKPNLFTADQLHASVSKSGMKNPGVGGRSRCRSRAGLPGDNLSEFRAGSRGPGPPHGRGAAAPAHPLARGTEPGAVPVLRPGCRPAAPGRPRPLGSPSQLAPSAAASLPATYPAGSGAPRNSSAAARACRLRGHDCDLGKRPVCQGPAVRAAARRAAPSARPSVRSPGE